MGHLGSPFRVFAQKLLEECDRNKEKVEECQRYAKQYIDAIKVPGVLGRAWGWAGGPKEPGELAGTLRTPLPAGL